jgi:hypothetical protein
MREGSFTLKKILLIPAALFFLAVSFAGAQDASVTPPHRKHTRPPYSGPRKSGGKASLPRRFPKSQGPSRLPLKGSSDHILVR